MQLSFDDIPRLYQDERYSTRQIAGMVGCCKATVRKRLQKSGVVLRTGRDATGITDLVGQRFSRLVVLEEIHLSNRGHIRYKCKCDCGKLSIAYRSCLLRGHTRSCGCLQVEIARRITKGLGLIGAKAWSRIVERASARGIQMNLTIEEAWDLYQRQNGRCALTGVEIAFGDRNNHTASLDRIDSKKEYAIDNVQWVHKVVNRMKSSFSEEEFIHFCTLVSSYTRHKRENTLPI